jgi:hypothetical protein
LLDPRVVREAFQQFNHRRSPKRHDLRLLRKPQRIGGFSGCEPPIDPIGCVEIVLRLSRQDDAGGEPEALSSQSAPHAAPIATRTTTHKLNLVTHNVAEDKP